MLLAASGNPPMPIIEFDRTIDTDLDPDRLWRLVEQAFEDPGTSPFWPVDLEETEPVAVREGNPITATYKIGPVRVRPSYHFVDVDPPRSLSYRSDADHPLDGGATIWIEPGPRGSILRWAGSYRTRRHPLAPFAYLFVRFYFLDTFFGRLKTNLESLGGDRPRV